MILNLTKNKTKKKDEQQMNLRFSHISVSRLFSEAEETLCFEGY